MSADGLNAADAGVFGFASIDWGAADVYEKLALASNNWLIGVTFSALFAPLMGITSPLIYVGSQMDTATWFGSHPYAWFFLRYDFIKPFTFFGINTAQIGQRVLSFFYPEVITFE